jgi:hypothetical protein
MNRVIHAIGCATFGFACATIAGIACGQSPNAGESPFSDGPPTQAEAVERSVLEGNPKVAGKPAADADDFCQCIGGSESSNSEMVKKIERVLKSPLHSSGLDFSDQPLNDVLAQLQEEYGIPIQIDHTALKSNGTRVDEPISVNIHNVSLRAALRLMLKTIGVTFVIQEEVLLITTPEEADRRLRVCVYNVTSIIGSSEQQIDALIDMLQSCVATESWSENGGGEAEIRAIKPGLLVISQTASIHEEIRELLTTIRNVRRSAAPADQRQAGHEHAAAEEVVTRSYTLQLNPTDDIDTMRSQVRELITGAMPDEVWSGRLGDGQPVTLTVFHDRVVVRQMPGVQDKVAKILSDSGIATPAAAGAPGGSPGGGFGGRGEGGGGGQGGGFFSRRLENEFGTGRDSAPPSPKSDFAPEGFPLPGKSKNAVRSTNPFE